MSVLNKEQRSRIMEEAINELDVITESDWFKDLVEEKVRKVLVDVIFVALAELMVVERRSVPARKHLDV